MRPGVPCGRRRSALRSAALRGSGPLPIRAPADPGPCGNGEGEGGTDPARSRSSLDEPPGGSGRRDFPDGRAIGVLSRGTREPHTLTRGGSK
ncbi:hypothetical protein HOK021_33920 [Streptomyces hygroscopicus]|nr:hypothetical protein HOK021_33920 [Streptomyces hygroscopicus]